MINRTMIPSFLLAKLYVKGSLKNTDSGFKFALKNIIDSTILIGMGPIRVGDKSYAGTDITITAEDKTVNGTKLTREKTLPVRIGVPIDVTVEGEPLVLGEQKVMVEATTFDIGKIKFDIKDEVA